MSAHREYQRKPQVRVGCGHGLFAVGLQLGWYACCHQSRARHLVTRGVLLPQGPLRKMVGKVLRQLLERADKESLVAGLEDERLGDMDDEADGLMDDEEDEGRGG